MFDSSQDRGNIMRPNCTRAKIIGSSAKNIVRSDNIQINASQAPAPP